MRLSGTSTLRASLRVASAIALLGGVLVRTATAQTSDPADPPPTPAYALKAPTSGWKGALIDSLGLLLIEHSTRIIFYERTRRELSGPFLNDYYRSVKRPATWGDGDGWVVNYVGHPIHGAAAAYLWIDHDARAPRVDLKFGRDYWTSRARAVAWSAVYSVQFELGPLSEASIGNVGMHRNTTGWVDHVITPLGGLAVLVAEDLADQHLLPRLEERAGPVWLRKALRVSITPARSFANIAQGRMPWYRASRPLR